MKKNKLKAGLVFAITTMFIGMSFITSTGQTISSMTVNICGNTLYVGGSESGNYSSIQEAIDNANNGDTIFVYDDSSPYYENIVIDVTIDLIGEDRDTTIIDGSGADYVVVINSPGVRITGFTVRNAGGMQGTGLRINSDNNEIHGNILTANKKQALHAFSSSYNTIFDNIISENNDWAVAMYISSGSHNFIHDCEITDTFGGTGIVLARSNYNNISNNYISSISRSIDLYDASYNEVFGNVITDNYWGIKLYAWTNPTTSPSHNIIKKNIVLRNTGGIDLEGRQSSHVTHNKIIQNNVSYNEGGIMLRGYTYNNEIYHNNLKHNINPWTEEPNNGFDYGDNNKWDSGKLGNYWSDYKEKYPYAKPKMDEPWIWNTPYGSDVSGMPLLYLYRR